MTTLPPPSDPTSPPPSGGSAARASEPPLPIDPQFAAAKRLYAEQFGDALVTSTYLKVTILVLAAFVGLLIWLQVETTKVMHQFKPLVLRIDGIGHADVVRYTDFAYEPREPEIKYFLSRWCELYYGRNPATLVENLAQARQFLSRDLREKVDRAWEETKLIETYLHGSASDTDIAVLGVAIEDLRTNPIRARVDFQEVLYRPDARIELKRATYTAHFAFHFDQAVLTNDILRVNPLGLRIDYFREDLAQIQNVHPQQRAE
jgi:type IV secretion system protein VirB5